MLPRRAVAGALALTLVVGACAGGGAASPDEAGAPSPTDEDRVPYESPAVRTDREPAARVSGGRDVGPARSSLADLVTPVGSTIYDPATLLSEDGPAPLAIDIPDLGIAGADITPVGVEDDGEMEIPGAHQVGWYEYGPIPGADGSAVLAAHIAYDGRDGVFRHLADLDEGDGFAIGYDDGSRRDFVVVERASYDKEALPFDRVFGRDGDPVVTLITCGGDFNRSLSSYEQNVVAYAIPV